MYAPSIQQIRAVASSRGGDSCAKKLWDGCVFAAHCQEPDGLVLNDASGYHRNGTLMGMDPATDHVVTRIGRALNFDGNDAYVLGPIFPTLAGSVTYAAWVKTSDPTRNQWGIIGNLNPATYDKGSDLVGYKTPGIAYYSPATGWVGSSLVLPTNLWAFVAVSVNQSVGVTIYLNDSTYFAADVTSAMVAGTTPMKIGQSYTGALLIGQMTNPAIWNRALLPSEISGLYTDPWGMWRLRRRVQVRGAGAPPTFKAAWVRSRSRIIGGGVA